MKIPPPRKDAAGQQNRNKHTKNKGSLTSSTKHSLSLSNTSRASLDSLPTPLTSPDSPSSTTISSISSISTPPSSVLPSSPSRPREASITKAQAQDKDYQALKTKPQEKATITQIPAAKRQLKSRIPIPVRGSLASPSVASPSLISSSLASPPTSLTSLTSPLPNSPALAEDSKRNALRRQFKSRIPIASKVSSSLATPATPASQADSKPPSTSSTPQSSQSSQPSQVSQHTKSQQKVKPTTNKPPHSTQQTRKIPQSGKGKLIAQEANKVKDKKMTWFFNKSKASASVGNPAASVSKGAAVAKDAAAVKAVLINATLPADVALKPGGSSNDAPPASSKNNPKNRTTHGIINRAPALSPALAPAPASGTPSSSLVPTANVQQQPEAKKAGPLSLIRKYTGLDKNKKKATTEEKVLEVGVQPSSQTAAKAKAKPRSYGFTSNINKLVTAYIDQDNSRAGRDEKMKASRAAIPPVLPPFDTRKSRRGRIYKDGTSQPSRPPPPRAQVAPVDRIIEKPSRPPLKRNKNYPPTQEPSRHPSLDPRRVPQGTSLEQVARHREYPPTAQPSERSSLDLRRFSNHAIFPVHVSNRRLFHAESFSSSSSGTSYSSSSDSVGDQFIRESIQRAIFAQQWFSRGSGIASGNNNQPSFDQQEEIGANFEVNSSAGQQHGPPSLLDISEEELLQLQLELQPEQRLELQYLQKRLLEEQYRMFEDRRLAALSEKVGMLDIGNPTASNSKASYPPTELGTSARSSPEMRRVRAKASLQQLYQPDLDRQCGPSFSRSTASSSRRTSINLDRRVQAEREAQDNVSQGSTSRVPEYQTHRTSNRGMMRHLSPPQEETYTAPPAYASRNPSRFNLAEIAESVRAIANERKARRERGSVSLASNSSGNSAASSRRASSSHVDSFTLPPRRNSSNVTNAGASGRNSLDVPGRSLTFRRTKSLASVHPLSQVESVDSPAPIPSSSFREPSRHVSMNVLRPEIPDIFEPPVEHREYGLFNTIAHPPKSAPRTDIRHLFPGNAEAGHSSSASSITPSGRPRILSTRAERAAERASRAAELEESVKTIRKRASDANVTASLLMTRRSDINISSTASASSSITARKATPAPNPPPREPVEVVTVNIPPMPNAELKELRKVTTDMPIAFWAGRFSGMINRIATMNQNVQGTDFDFKGYVMQRLKKDVGNEAALKSYNEFYYNMINRRNGDEWYESWRDRDRDRVVKIVFNEMEEKD